MPQVSLTHNLNLIICEVYDRDTIPKSNRFVHVKHNKTLNDTTQDGTKRIRQGSLYFLLEVHSLAAA